MGSMSIWHWLIVLAVVLLLFGGGGKIPRLMKDMGTGIKSFKKGLKDEDKAEGADGEGDNADPAKKLPQEPAVASTATADATTASDKNKTAAGS
ncbi:MAG: twin-arginine translocase TatA/TatE family subunit [Pseudomonadota bacterium]